jgi:hypothetical protein
MPGALPVTVLTDEELAEYRTPPPPLGRCTVCGGQSWMLHEGVPMHPCCVRAEGECEACRISEGLELKAASRMASYKRLRDGRAVR